MLWIQDTWLRIFQHRVASRERICQVQEWWKEEKKEETYGESCLQKAQSESDYRKVLLRIDFQPDQQWDLKLSLGIVDSMRSFQEYSYENYTKMQMTECADTVHVR